MDHRGRRTSRITGRVYTAGGGGPNRPVVVMCSTGVWIRPNDAHFLLPATITPHWCRVLDGDARTIRKIVDADLEEWRSTRSPSARAIVTVDVGSNPAAHRVLESDGYNAPTEFRHVIVNGGNGEGDTFESYGRQILGARYLVSWFDRTLWKNPLREEPPMSPYGAPQVEDQIIIVKDPDVYSVPKDGGISWQDVGKAAASTEDLVRRTGVDDGEVLAGISADETIAIALMLQLWAADRNPPMPVDTQPLRRRLSGVF